LKQQKYNGSSSKQQHSEMPPCDQALPKLQPSHAFAREGEVVVVAQSCEEKDAAVDFLFWKILPW